MNIDLPYMSQWFEYYHFLGIDFFYLYYVDNTFYKLEELLDYFPKNKVIIKEVKLENITNSNDLFYDIPFCIKEDYILHIDSDEFLYLDHKNIKIFLQENKIYDAFYFYWYMCPSNKIELQSLNEILKDKSNKKYFIKNYKILFKNKDFTYIKGYSHDVTFLQNNVRKKYMENPYFLIHFSYRGIYDCYYKYSYQKLLNHNDKDTKINIINQNIKSLYIHQLPSRILVYLGEINNKNQNIEINIILPIISKNQFHLYTLFENDTINRDLFIKNIKILEKYQIYKDIIITNPNIKNHIKNISQNMNVLIKLQ